MSYPMPGSGAARRLPTLSTLRSFARRLAHFLVVWTALLLVHEAGHAIVGARQGMEVRRVTVGFGPELWRGEIHGTETVIRLVPLAGVTTMRDRSGIDGAEPAAWGGWERQLVTLGGGVGATLALAAAMALVVAAWERGRGRRWRWGRFVVADALVLTVFNFLPVPPLDGGRALLGAIGALRGAPLTGDTLFWVQVAGLALAIVPMALWTGWTARIDRAAATWGAPAPSRA